LAEWPALVARGPAALLPAPDGLAATLVRRERAPDGLGPAGLVPPELAVAEPPVAELPVAELPVVEPPVVEPPVVEPPVVELVVAELPVVELAAACERGGAGLAPPAVADGRVVGWSAGAVDGLNVATDSIAPATRHTARMLASSGMTVPGPENGPVRRRSRFRRRCARNSRW